MSRYDSIGRCFHFLFDRHSSFSFHSINPFFPIVIFSVLLSATTFAQDIDQEGTEKRYFLFLINETLETSGIDQAEFSLLLKNRTQDAGWEGLSATGWSGFDPHGDEPISRRIRRHPPPKMVEAVFWLDTESLHVVVIDSDFERSVGWVFSDNRLADTVRLATITGSMLRELPAKNVSPVTSMVQTCRDDPSMPCEDEKIRDRTLPPNEKLTLEAGAVVEFFPVRPDYRIGFCFDLSYFPALDDVALGPAAGFELYPAVESDTKTFHTHFSQVPFWFGLRHLVVPHESVDLMLHLGLIAKFTRIEIEDTDGFWGTNRFERVNLGAKAGLLVAWRFFRFMGLFAQIGLSAISPGQEYRIGETSVFEEHPLALRTNFGLYFDVLQPME